MMLSFVVMSNLPTKQRARSSKCKCYGHPWYLNSQKYVRWVYTTLWSGYANNVQKSIKTKSTIQIP